MASAVRASVTELPESRVRVEAEVAAEEVARRMEQTASALGRQLRVPGFRKGKVPPPVVIRRIGREAVLDEAVRKSLGGWYADAIDAAGIVPVGDPELALGELPDEGQPLTFTIEIGVRPTAALGTYKGLEVGRREPDVSEEAVERELEALRERLARLDTLDGPAEAGDFAVIDYDGTVAGEPFEGGGGRDQLVELGAGRLLEGFDEQLLGAAAGERRTVEVHFPDDYGAEELAGKDAVFDVTVKEVKRKRLPELDDEFAVDAAGFDTLAELREDIRTRLTEAETRAIESEFRDAVLDAVAAEADIDLPEGLVAARAEEMWEQLAHTLGHRGISKEAYLRIAGKSEQDVIEEAKADAGQALRREAALAAIVEAEGIEPSDEEVLEALEGPAEQQQTTPAELLDRLRQAGRLDALRRDLAARSALDLIAAEAKPITVEQAKARKKLWTPGKEASAGAGELWTPGEGR